MNLPQSTDPMTSAILESISDGVFTVDEAWRITSFNRAAEEITGVDREEALGRPCCEVLRASLCQSACPLRQTMEKGKSLLDIPAWFVDADGERVPVRLSTAILRDAGGKVLGAAETFRDLRESVGTDRIREAMRRFGDLTSRSPKMQEIFAMLPKVAASRSTVLITGESGTGKEVLARAIHSAGPRAAAPFVALNCAAFPDTLIENELFGHEKGAFTGADRRREGRISQAGGGTLFLDEIGDVSSAFQVRLLRLLQERTYEPLGTGRTESTNARFLAATHQDLPALVRKGRFREDLLWRLDVIRIHLPPLRERKEDIPDLAIRFARRFGRLAGHEEVRIHPVAMERLLAHDWPGNVRELENRIERAVVLAGSDEILPEYLMETPGVSGTKPKGLVSGRDAAEVRMIRDALSRTDGNRTAAAKILGIHRSTLIRKLARYGEEGHG
ncbi:sigma-54 interaction domain-containing protein [Desulfoluna spongiiphila]|uniref:PAS domain S-box-containing protein n=1 Tax=Desulfoluna spongiiphila TaxID=419481 RepID=A0A1G5G290_9BACT|nr:sigma 54-interacting transcriptional regulator [Desulfoluna spongiiphila]SCY45672.1 PAS domain S-box-containing protein [Desulfoluna spongiiphila]